MTSSVQPDNAVWDTIPQEILLSISEFGQIAPGLDESLVNSVILSVSPNWSWMPELIIEEMRSQLLIYSTIEKILEYCDHHGVSVLIRDDLLIIKSLIPETLHTNDITVSSDEGYTFITSDIPGDITTSHWLYDPRPDPNMKNMGYDISPPINRALIVNQYIHDTSISSDEALRIIVKNNPQYNLGRILSRLRSMKERMNTKLAKRMYRLCHSKYIRSMLPITLRSMSLILDDRVCSESFILDILGEYTQSISRDVRYRGHVMISFWNDQAIELYSIIEAMKGRVINKYPENTDTMELRVTRSRNRMRRMKRSCHIL
uniref:Uncharacterized protein n=1 Tax=viral metagenome TaxID=1070528 RepID=A0A6C0BN19_9ZZZZ